MTTGRLHYEKEDQGCGAVWRRAVSWTREDEGRKILTDEQYDHMKHQVRSLAGEDDPTHPATVSVDDLGDGLYELREKAARSEKSMFVSSL